jgi:hypothetical protein
VLLVGRSFDPHLDLVARELSARGHPSARIELDLVAGGGRWAATRDRLRDLPLTAGFFRPINVLDPLAHHGERAAMVLTPWGELPPAVHPFVSAQLEGAVLGWVDDQGIDRWVNDPWVLPRAELKLRQLRLAAAAGFSVPRTVVTDDPDEARTFAGDCPDGVVYKGLADPMVSVGREEAAFLYTSPVDAPLLARLDDLLRYPGIFQERLVPTTEARITVVGEQAFAARVGVGLEHTVDWRRALHTGVECTSAHVADTVLDAAISTVNALGLRFGAVDLIETASGYQFLEVNPSGAFSWLEHDLGLPIAEAICDELLARGEAR